MYRGEESTSWGESETMQELTRCENFVKTNRSKGIYSRLMKSPLETVPFMKISISPKHTQTPLAKPLPHKTTLCESLEKGLVVYMISVESDRSRNLKKEITMKSRASWNCRYIEIGLHFH